jgi:hypothetical protein
MSGSKAKLVLDIEIGIVNRTLKDKFLAFGPVVVGLESKIRLRPKSEIPRMSASVDTSSRKGGLGAGVMERVCPTFPV